MNIQRALRRALWEVIISPGLHILGRIDITTSVLGHFLDICLLAFNTSPTGPLCQPSTYHEHLVLLRLARWCDNDHILSVCTASNTAYPFLMARA